MLNLRYFGLENQVIFKIEDAARMSFSDQSFNVIFSINVFHHLEKSLAVLDEINRLLRNDGKVVLSDFSDKGLEIINACHTAEGRTHDYFKHRLNEAKEYFIRKGFKIMEYQSQVQKVLIAQRL
jgi:ubiquinone/menaquinone biosynthesis C-methylase UbiE